MVILKSHIINIFLNYLQTDQIHIFRHNFDVQSLSRTGSSGGLGAVNQFAIYIK